MPSVFLAHSSVDKPVVVEVKNCLSEAGVDVWFDEDELAPGNSLFGGINAGLAQVDCVAVFLSPASIKSRWVTMEMSAAFSAHVVLRMPIIIPVLLPDLDERDIPPLIRDRISIRYQGDSRVVAEEILRGTLRSYSDAHAYAIRMISPAFPGNCTLRWTDPQISSWLASAGTGSIGSGSPLDKEYLLMCETDAPKSVAPDLVIQVQGSGSMLWPQSCRWVSDNIIEGRVFLKEGSRQRTTMIFSLYEPDEAGSILCSRRSFTIR